MNDCTACPLHAVACSVNVGGVGDGRILIVGMNPGAEENIAGEPFIGKAGKLLKEMLADAGFVQSDYRLTNAVRCFTPKDTPMDTTFIDACRHHLKAEIEQVQPEVIIALGDVALRSLCKLSGVQAKRGKSFSLHESFGRSIEVWPTYHPAFVLRVPNARSTVVADLRRVRDRATPQNAIPWRWAVADVPETYDELCALDIETPKTVDEKGKVSYGERPVQIAITGADTVYVARDEGEWLRTQCAIASALELITHNGWAFDIPKIREHLLPDMPWGRDTLVMAYLDDETQPLGLEALAVKYLGVRGWKEEKDAPVGSDEFAAYNARDAYYTLRLYNALLEVLGTSALGIPRIRIADEIILPAKLALDAATERGIFINAAEVERVERETQAALDDALGRIREIVQNEKFNPNSDAQVAAFLMGFGLVPTKYTEKTNKPSFDKSVMNELATARFGRNETEHAQRIRDFAKAMLDYRKARKALSTYVKPYKKAAQSDDGRMHSTYHVYKRDFGSGGTVTGRASSSDADSGKWAGRGTNEQNLDRRFKSFHGAAPGHKLVSADYAAIEFRLGAWVSGERVVLDHYAADAGWDPHVWFASIFYGNTEAEVVAQAKAFKELGNPNSMRQIAKSANFSQWYLGTGFTMHEYAKKQGIDIPLPSADRAHQTWHRALPNVFPWYDRVWRGLLENGYVENAVGRRRHFGDPKLLITLPKPMRDAILREACNFLVQSLAWELAAIALGCAHRAGLPLVGFVHDDFKFEFAEYDADSEIALTMQHVLVDEPLRVLDERFGVKINVPITIDISTTHSHLAIL